MALKTTPATPRRRTPTPKAAPETTAAAEPTPPPPAATVVAAPETPVAPPVAKPAAAKPASADPFSAGLARLAPGLDKAVQFHQANLEALVKINHALAAGLQTLSQEMVAQTQASFEKATSRGKQAAEVKTLKQAIDLSVAETKLGYETLIANGTRLTELGAKITKDALGPLANRIETLVKPR